MKTENEDLIEIEDTQCEVDSDDVVTSKEKNSRSKRGRRKGNDISKRKISTNDKEEDDLVVDLIKAVYQREPLWNSTLPYEKRGYKVTSALWNEVGQLLNLTSAESQTKFKNLRDRYVRLAGEKKQHNEMLDPPQWKYYELLKFLQPTITYRTTNPPLKRKERSISPAEYSSENSESTSNAKAFYPDNNTSANFIKKQSNSEISNMTGMSPFEAYCVKQLELLNKPPDKISTFCAYLESELRNLSDQKVENIKENILYLILQAKKGHIK